MACTPPESSITAPPAEAADAASKEARPGPVPVPAADAPSPAAAGNGSGSTAAALPHGAWSVAFEGVDGSGKTTQARMLADALTAAGRAATLTRQPGDGPGLGPDGAAVREMVLDPDNADLTVEARHLLFAADNAQNIARVVIPALSNQRIAVIDRGPGSALAYQGFGERLGTERVSLTYGWSTRWFWPSVTVEVASDRRHDKAFSRRDFFERQPAGFHRRVREGYDWLSRTADRWTRVVAEQGDDPHEVHLAVLEALRAADRRGWLRSEPQEGPEGPWAPMLRNTPEPPRAA